MSGDIWGEARSTVAQGDTVDGHRAMEAMVAALSWGGVFAAHEQRAEVTEYLHQQCDRHALRWPIRIYGLGGSCRESAFYQRHVSSSKRGACSALSVALAGDRESIQVRADHAHKAFVAGLHVEDVMRDGLDTNPNNKLKMQPRAEYDLPLPVRFTNPASLDGERFVWPVQCELLYALVDSFPATHDRWRHDAIRIIQDIGSLYDSRTLETFGTNFSSHTTPIHAASRFVEMGLGRPIRELEELEVNQVTVRRRLCEALRYAGTIEGIWLTIFARLAPLHWGRSYNVSHWEQVGGEENRTTANACSLAFTDALNALYRAARKQGGR